MRPGKCLATLLLATLGGCGGGYVSVGIGSSFCDCDVPFVFWSGSANGDRVVDVNNKAFAFFADNGCLYNFQTDRENQAFCLTHAGDTAQYGPAFLRIANVRSIAGTCIAALLDAATGRFIDIELDTAGREVVFVTATIPQSCIG